MEDWINCVRHCIKIQEDDFSKEVGERGDNFYGIVTNLREDYYERDSTVATDSEGPDSIGGV